MIQRAYLLKLRLNNKQQAYFRECAGAARFVYNWALADRIEAYKRDKTSVNKFEQKKRFNALKKDTFPWLSEYPYKLVAQAFYDLDDAYRNFFRRVKKGADEKGFPKFRNKYQVARFCFGDSGFRVEEARIRLPRVGWVTLEEKNYLPVNAKINRVTATEHADGWYISVQVEMPDIEPVALEGVIGIDLGIKSLATLSDGRTFDNPRTLNAYEKKVATLNRELSRRKLGSKNRKKTKAKLAKLHARIKNVRRHTLHNISAHAVYEAKPKKIVLENLNVQGMMANHKLAKSLSDASMGELGRQIEYKAEWTGIEVVYADRWFPSSKTCSQCGSVKPAMSLRERTFVCECCGAVLDRDHNAALNLANYTAK